jgi:hypothetical protein
MEERLYLPRPRSGRFPRRGLFPAEAPLNQVPLRCRTHLLQLQFRVPVQPYIP